MYVPKPLHQPTPEAKAASLRSNLADRAEVDRSGYLTVSFPPRVGAFLVRRLVVQGPAATVVRVYTGTPDPINLADATINGAGDVADYSQPLYVPPGSGLVVRWQKSDGTPVADNGATYARAEVEDV